MNNKESIDKLRNKILLNDQLSDLDKSAALKNLFDAEKAVADSNKSEIETEKAKVDTDNAKKPQPKEVTKLFISTLAPLLTALALIGTFYFQIQQTSINNDNQIRSTEDVAWREMLKRVDSTSIAKNDPTLPTLIKSFYTSTRYGNQAREISILYLSNIAQRDYFKILFKSVSTKIVWSDFDELTTLMNLLKWHRDASYLDGNKFTEINEEMYYVGLEISRLLKNVDSTRPKVIDLTGVELSNQNLDSANFSGAILAGFTMRRCSIMNANLSNISEYDYPYYSSNWEQTAWWRANNLDANLVRYLLNSYPRLDTIEYWQSPHDRNDYCRKDSVSYLRFVRR